MAHSRSYSLNVRPHGFRITGTNETNTEIMPSEAIAKIDFFMFSPRINFRLVGGKRALHTLKQSGDVHCAYLSANLCSVIHYSFCWVCGGEPRSRIRVQKWAAVNVWPRQRPG
jgi:hypothetical protein